MRQKYYRLGAPGGVTKVGSPKFFFGVIFGKTLIADDTRLIKTYFFFVKQISDDLKNIHGRNYLVAYAPLPITAPYKKPWFWQFFGFSGKTRKILLYYFLILCATIWGQFFPVLSRGVTYNFSLETPQNRPKNTNFLNIHQIKNWEYETLCKNKWLRRWWQNFWVSTNFATFLIKKIMILNIGIWVLKRSVLTRQIQWCMRKII